MLVLIRASRDTSLIYGQQARDYLIDRPIFLAQTPGSGEAVKIVEARHVDQDLFGRRCWGQTRIRKSMA